MESLFVSKFVLELVFELHLLKENLLVPLYSHKNQLKMWVVELVLWVFS